MRLVGRSRWYVKVIVNEQAIANIDSLTYYILIG